MKLKKKQKLLQKRRWRIRKKVKGTAECPRLSLCISHQHIYAQCIDDVVGKTTVYLSTLSKDFKGKDCKPNVAGAAVLGKEFGQKAKTAGVNRVVFDRGGRRFHGAVKAFAEAARESITF